MPDSENVGIVQATVSSYLWEVKNFCVACKNIGDGLFSPVFTTTFSSTDYKWKLLLHPKGDYTSAKDYTSIYLQYLGKINVQINVTISLLDDKNLKICELTFPNLFEPESKPLGRSNFVKQNFITNKTNRVLINDTIKIHCEIIYDENLASPSKKKCVEENVLDNCRLAEFDDFGKLLEDESSTDVIIRIGKDEIKVHKIIIMNRSPVFQAMFEHDMKEKDENIIEISDIKYEVMKEVVRLMYAGTVNDIDTIAGDLLLAGEKYSIKGLKVICEKHLSKNLKVENILEDLKLADLCNAINLKSEIIKFVVQNQQDVVYKPEFKLLPVELECEILRAIVGINLKE